MVQQIDTNKAEKKDQAGENAQNKEHPKCDERRFIERLNCDPVSYYTRWLAYVTGFLALGTVVLAYFTLKIWNAGEDAIKISRDTMIAQTRPWLKFSSVALKKMWIDESGVHVEAIINVENVGHSPATKATINPRLAIDSFNGWFSPIVKRKAIKTDGNNFGRTVFSGEKWEYRIQFSVSADAIQADRAKQIDDVAKVIKESGMSTDISPWVPFDPMYYIVCQVDYEFDASNIVHNTVRRFMIFMRNPSGPEGSGFKIPNVPGNVDLTTVELLDIGDIRGD